jgi:hypothetical protein
MSKTVKILRRIYFKETDFKRGSTAILNDHDATYFEKKGWGVIQIEEKDKKVDESDWESLSDIL